MTTFRALPHLLDHLKNYGKGDLLKRQAMLEVESILQELGMSRRQFVRRATQLGLSVTTVTSLGNWISCKYIPQAEHISLLIEALEAVLHDLGKITMPKIATEQLQASSFKHDQELIQLRQEVQDVPFATQMIEDTLNWIALSEFPIPHSSLTSAFIPITRQHAIQRLNLLREVHSEALETTLFPNSLPHALLVATASLTVSHSLLEVGQAALALEAADEGIYVLEDVLIRYPYLRTEPMFGYSFRNWSQLEIVGLMCKANVYKSMARSTTTLPSHFAYVDLARATLQVASQKASLLEVDREHTETGILRDTAELLIEFGSKNLEEAEKLTQRAAQSHAHMDYADDPLLYYLIRITQAKALIPQGKLLEAKAVLQDAQAAADYAKQAGKVVPGPLHYLEYLRAETALYYAHAQTVGLRTTSAHQYTSGWKEKVIERWRVAQATGLVEEQQRLLNEILQADHQFRQLVIADLHKNTS